MKRLCLLVAIVSAGVMASTANAWHAAVTASAKCNVQTGLFDITGSIVSSDPSGAVIKSVTPTSFPGNTQGNQQVKITVDWPDNDENPTYTVYVSLNGTCIKVCEPVVETRFVDRIVYVDREVIKEVPVDRVVEKIVYVPKTVVKWKTRTVVKWKTRTVVKRIIITKVVHDRCPPPPVCCVGKG